MEIILTIVRIICMGLAYFVLGALLLGLTGSVMLVTAYLWSLVKDSWKREYQEKHADLNVEFEQLHAEITDFLAQIRKEIEP